jgi:hypothetical protein
VKYFRHLLPRLLIECILIVLSVVLALAVNNWNVQRQNHVRAREARDAFISEITTNRKMLASDLMLGHHRRLQKVYAQAMTSHSADPQALFETGLHVPTFGDAAWRSFSSSTIFADFTVTEVILLSDIYHAQENIERRAESFLIVLTSPRADRETAEYERDSAVSIALFLNDLVPAEERLVARYEEGLQRLQYPR